VNQLRKHFGFEGVPVRMFYKEKRRSERKGVAPEDPHASKRPKKPVRGGASRDEDGS
jgi:hypothetical protein